MSFVPSYPLANHLIHACGGNSEAQELIAAINAGGSGSGTVTTVSIVTANGVSGTVANPTTTPAITISLGDITPTSVTSSGAVTGSNLSGSSSGTNTGDQTITLTGDVTGSGTGSFVTTISSHVVTYAKMQQAVNPAVLIGNPTLFGNRDLLEIQISSDFRFDRGFALSLSASVLKNPNLSTSGAGDIAVFADATGTMVEDSGFNISEEYV